MQGGVDAHPLEPARPSRAASATVSPTSRPCGRPRPWWTIWLRSGPVDGVPVTGISVPSARRIVPDIAGLAAALGVEDRAVDDDPARLGDVGHDRRLGRWPHRRRPEQKRRHRSGSRQESADVTEAGAADQAPSRRRLRITSCGPIVPNGETRPTALDLDATTKRIPSDTMIRLGTGPDCEGLSVTDHACGHPSDRALDALLAAYAAGSLGPPLHALVAGHLALNPGSRAFVRSLEAANAAALEASSPVPVPNREAKLAAIFAKPAARPIGADPAPDPCSRRRSRRFLGIEPRSGPWQERLPGIKAFRIEDDRPRRGGAVLDPARPPDARPHPRGLRIHPRPQGRARRQRRPLPARRHRDRGSEIDHRPQADADEDCICYTVTDAPLRLTGPVGRILQRLFGRALGAPDVAGDPGPSRRHGHEECPCGTDARRRGRQGGAVWSASR